MVRIRLISSVEDPDPEYLVGVQPDHPLDRVEPDTAVVKIRLISSEKYPDSGYLWYSTGYTHSTG